MIPQKAESTSKGLFVLLKRDEMLTTQDVARWLKHSPRTITDLAERWHDTGGQEGIPGGFKLGRAWCFRAKELEDWIAQRMDPKRDISAANNKKQRAIA